MASAYRFMTVNTFRGYENQELVTTYQARLVGTGTTPRTHLKLIDPAYFQGFQRLQCIHEVRDQRPHRYGDDLPYENESVAAPREPYEVYYKPGDDYLIFRGSGDAAKGAFKRLRREFPTKIDVDEGWVDFSYVLDRIQGDVAGSWFTGLPGRVRSAGFFGDNVRLDPAFNSYDPKTMSALYLSLVLDGFDTTIQVMITVGRGVIIHENWSVERDLEFLMGIRPLLFGGNPLPRGRKRKSLRSGLAAD